MPSISADLDLDSQSLLAHAIAVSGRSKYAFALKAGLAPSLLSRYLNPNGSQMSPRKLKETLERNGFVVKLAVSFEPAAEEPKPPRRRIVEEYERDALQSDTHAVPRPVAVSSVRGPIVAAMAELERQRQQLRPTGEESRSLEIMI
jgi:hypothetical protein